MNLDRACVGFCLALLPILWLPQVGLNWVAYGAILSLLVAILRRKWLYAVVAGAVALSYGQVVQLAERANQVSAQKSSQRIEIVKILDQNPYQTAIAKLDSGESIYLNWQAETPLKLNQLYQAQLNLRPISGRLNEGNFSRQRWLLAQKLTATATVKQAEILPQTTFPLRTQWFYRTFQQTENLATQGLLLALAFGERAWLPNEQWTIFQQTTTAHLIAISGLHIALAMGIGFWIAKLGLWGGWRFFPLQAVRLPLILPYAVGFLLAVEYSFLAGFSVPTLRALLAISVVLLCRFARRHYSAWQLWWRVVAVLLLFDPLAILSESFWLSILAVASLIFWYRYFSLSQWQARLGRNFSKSTRLLVGLVHLQLGIGLIFAPVQFFFFEGSTPLALLANLLIVPLYSLVLVPLILISLLTDNLFLSWQLAGWLAQQSLIILTPMADFWWIFSRQQQWLLVGLNGMILAILYGWLYQKSRIYWLRMAIISLIFQLGFWGLRWKKDPSQWLMFDVGQGLAMALVYHEQGQKKAVMFDSGGSWGEAQQRNSMAKLEILPYLRREGIELAAIFLSHDDNDHSGGVVDLLTAFPQAKLISSSKIRYGDKSPEPCVAGQQWQFGEFRLTSIFPHKTVERAKNQDSCIILAESDRLQWLFTGDTGQGEERRFAQAVGKIDFLQLAHHGSKTSTSETLLAQTKPQIAVVGTGRWNPWRMPNQSVVERVEQRGIKLWDTAKVGMIKLEFEQDNWTVSGARSPNSAWYQQLFGQAPQK
ncbi:DNA internalization-related competence protein ComEC/Rec2 [Haemophilus paracuniculus]|uniref:DNA internalization-related competence protein ComEC/Rec2 n=1 Tax=Haemophilus paracuniculus TaxID=734 RepID=A0A1T0AS97_9PAST|nr:DNA internalization-related competence protein ComEC/Rec2 [Haemophilus paracuniculus]OOR99309.1 DNA internalization-related competence protein ComEC/Rec2 [Haemophilus paracuniculus]